MKGAAARARLASAAGLARSLDLAPTRARRLAGASAQIRLSLAELGSWPQWPREPEAEQRRIFAVTALRASDDALRTVISGDTLRAYAAQIGEALLEDVLAKPGQGAAPLPPPAMLAAAGQATAHKALPPRLAERLGASGLHDREAARHVAEAEALVRMAPEPAA
ncbi:hypothetical protein HNO88_002178 [Novosphingobium chloroacetimidivorans]|uniref:Uncharacterized protein n=1 Tax=Novosphingobium chloroacetimidivorans TaxID=1428314 RepID=A0A7W7K9S0_9SPHN|nr:hypothetical protein [Novosphingobium chloroacetimidivorans]MBB4858852.1 hypothetical protein [Novosphingobium chloroacetimidivorans]